MLTLQERQRWNKPRRNTKVGDIVLIKGDSEVNRNQWHLAKVLEVTSTVMVHLITRANVSWLQVFWIALFTSWCCYRRQKKCKARFFVEEALYPFLNILKYIIEQL